MSEAGTMLKTLRKRHKLTQAEMGQSLNFSRYMVNQIERGHRPLMPATALKLEERFDQRAIDWLYAAARDALAAERTRA